MWSPRIGLDGDQWRVTFLDVGQGDSAVIELPDGTTVLVDGGARYERFDMGRSVIGPFLWNRGIRHLDHVIGTHQQLDHVGGLIWILGHIQVGRYWTSGVTREERFVADLQRALRDAGLAEEMAVRGQEVLAGGPCRLRILSPSQNESIPVSHTSSGTVLNNRSIVSRLECGSHAVLFAADIEVDGLHRLGADGRQPVTVLKVPHHGSRSSLDPAWIADVHPQYAVVSVGRVNGYGHPVQAVLDAYAEQHSSVTRTDHDGAVWFTARLSSREITVTRMRDLVLEPVVRDTALWQGEQRNWRRAMRMLNDMHPLPLVHS
jgi:competence protein ComEC